MRFVFLLIFLLLSVQVYAELSDLYVCREGGINNIVHRSKLPAHAAHCQPYSAAAVGAPSKEEIKPASRTPSNRAAPAQAPQKTQTAAPQTSTSATSESVPSTNSNLYACPDGQGGYKILERKKLPKNNWHCRLYRGSKSISTTEAKSQEAAAPSDYTIIEERISPPQDVYKCFDERGRPSYVAENQSKDFKECKLFSRSFKKAQANMRQQAQRENLHERALANLQKQEKRQLDNTTGLECTGAGYITIQGKRHEFGCARRSYDYSKGSSGGNVRYGDQKVVLPPNRDYYGTQGSCGGLITTDIGKTFHIEPTKNCPPALLVAAREVERQVEQSLNVPVNTDFIRRRQSLAPQINRIAREIGVDVYLVHAVISAESAYKSKAVSKAGARGLMQLMPATAQRFGVKDSFNTAENIRGGTLYLRWLLEKFNGNMELTIAAYNAGEGNVIKYGYTIPPFIETKAYVPKVLEYYRSYRNNPALIDL